jgi:hypothetical protein
VGGCWLLWRRLRGFGGVGFRGNRCAWRSPLMPNQTFLATISPHPKSLSRGERDFESCSLLPSGEGLGMRARVCSKDCLIWYKKGDFEFLRVLIYDNNSVCSTSGRGFSGRGRCFQGFFPATRRSHQPKCMARR